MGCCCSCCFKESGTKVTNDQKLTSVDSVETDAVVPVVTETAAGSLSADGSPQLQATQPPLIQKLSAEGPLSSTFTKTTSRRSRGASIGAKFGAHAIVSGQRYRFYDTKNDIDLDLTYIADNLIAMAAPFEGAIVEMYRNPLEMCQRFFELRHANHFAIYDVRGRLEESSFYDSKHFQVLGGTVVHDFAVEDHCPCGVPKLLAFCEHVEEYLNAHEDNVAAVHCKAGKGRTGFMCAALFLFQGKALNVTDSIELFSALRTKDKKTVNRPSQKRFLKYFNDYVLRQQWTTEQLEESVRIKSIRFDNLPEMDLGLDKSDPFFKILDESKKVLFDMKKEAPEYIKAVKANASVVFSDETLLSQIPDLKGAFCVELWDDDLLPDDFISFSWYQSGIAKEQGQITLHFDDIDEVDRHKLHTIPEGFAVTVEFE